MMKKYGRRWVVKEKDGATFFGGVGVSRKKTRQAKEKPEEDSRISPPGILEPSGV